MDESTIYRLYIAREIMREGIEAAQEPSPVSRMRSLLSLDQAVELVLRATLPLTGYVPKQEESLPSLLGALVDRKSGLTSHRPGIERARRLRNGVQHDGTIPSSEAARTTAVEVEAFIRALVQEILGKGVEELTPISLIEDQESRERLRRAYDALENGQAEEACIEAAVAFYGGSARALHAILSPSHRNQSRRIVERLFAEIGRAAEMAAGRAGDHTLREFAEAFERELGHRDFFVGDIFEPLERAVLFSSFGIAPSELRRFEEASPMVLFTLDGAHQVITPTRGWPPTREAAGYAVDFAVRAILRLESWARK